MSRRQLQLDDPGAPDFAPRVVEILNSTIWQDSQTSCIDAASAINALFKEACSEGGRADGFLWWFWDLLHDLSRQVAYSGTEAERFMDVIKALHDLPATTVNVDVYSKEECTIEVWKKLPFFGVTYREKLDWDPRSPGETQTKERHVNLQAYGARVAGLKLIDVNSWGVWSIWTMVDALEGTMTPIWGAPDEINEDPAAVKDISYKTKSAAAWIIHAGHLMYGRDEEIHGATAGPLWKLSKKKAVKLRRKTKGTDGFCLERWQLWKERFGVIRDATELDSDIRKEAEQAWRAMDLIERKQGVRDAKEMSEGDEARF